MNFTDKQINQMVEEVVETIKEDKEIEMNDAVNQYMDKVCQVSDDEASLMLRGFHVSN